MKDGQSTGDQKAGATDSTPGDLNLDLDESSQGMLPKIIKFTDLARCGDEIWIEFDSQLYRLRKTRQGKLILTK